MITPPNLQSASELLQVIWYGFLRPGHALRYCPCLRQVTHPCRKLTAAQVEAILRLGSPGFPRRHCDPDDYLRRTLARAALELQRSPFPARDTPRRVDSLPAAGLHHG